MNDEYIYNPLYFIIAYDAHDYDKEKCPIEKLLDFYNIACFEGGLK